MVRILEVVQRKGEKIMTLKEGRKIPMRCPGCQSKNISYVEIDIVQCADCGGRTDPYEAMQVADKEGREGWEKK